jgi:hypothetical protein
LLRPVAESLESRQLLSSAFGTPTAQVSGTDPDGAQWTLRLYGPGTLNVVDQNGTAFTADTKTTPDLINTITIGGAITTQTRLVGTVTPAPDGNSNVYFENLVVTPSGELGKIDVGQVNNFRQVQNGIFAIDMPNFYLAHTDTAKPSTPSQIHTAAQSAGEIFIPQGVITLRFGGVDANFTPAGGTPLNQTGQNNEFEINLGLPIITGTSIIVNKVVSNAQANTSATAPPFQDMVTFLVSGRLNLFQANEIDGNTTGQGTSSSLVPTQLINSTPTNGASPGGTYVISQGGPATGQIGDVRIGGSATNLTTFVTEDPINVAAAEGQLDAKISNFYIGGQTNNVLLVAPSGARNISFGLGMDNVTIATLAISSLRANRDATNANVEVSRSIGNVLIGGDVTDTNMQVGQFQSLFLWANLPPTSVFASGTGAFFGEPPPTIANRKVNPLTGVLEPFAQNGGTMKLRIAGSVSNSIFSASVDSNPSGLTPSAVDSSGIYQKPKGSTFPYGAPDNLVLPRGIINAKVEGQIDNSANSLVAPEASASAFFARTVHVFQGPVIPPIVPYQPFGAPTVYHAGQRPLKGAFKIDHIPAIVLAGPRRAKRSAK